MRSLRVRLLLLMLLVLVVTGGLSAWFASLTITDRFEQYLVQRQETSRKRRESLAQLLPALFADHYAATGHWERAAPLVQQLSALTTERILLLDHQGQLVADSAGDQARPPLSDDLSAPHLVQFNGQVVGSVQIPPTPLVSNSGYEKEYIAQVNRALLTAVTAAGIIALLLTWALSRGVLQRVKLLTTAVRQMEHGDLTQRVKNGVQDEIGHLAHAFNAMADSLARIEQLRRNMVSDVAHELRTPLSNICGYLEAIQDGVVQPTPEVTHSLFEEAMLLNRLVNDLQELAVAEAGQLRLAQQQVNVYELVDKAVCGLQGRVNGSKTIQTQVEPNLPPLYIDAERIGQVLRNLLNNAVEYTTPNGTIRVAVQRVDGVVQFNVFNEGVGIPPEHLPNIFERFYRIDSSRTRSTGGSGLGLAIVKNLVEAHHGRVWVESRYGSYASFYFTLPIHGAPT